MSRGEREGGIKSLGDLSEGIEKNFDGSWEKEMGRKVKSQIAQDSCLMSQFAISNQHAALSERVLKGPFELVGLLCSLDSSPRHHRRHCGNLYCI